MAARDLRRERRSHHPVMMKRRLVHESVNTELLSLGGVEGAIGTGLLTRVSWIPAKVDVRCDAEGFRCEASGLHPQ
jgi:hypothetical protein